MQHLDLETIARLVDEAPSPHERAHLDRCDHCRAELEAMRHQTESLRALPDLRPPVGHWNALEQRLMAEGLLHPAPRRWFHERQSWLRAAAALALFLGGTAFGTALQRGGFRPDAAARAGTDAGATISAQTVTSVHEAAEAVRLAQQQYFNALLRYRDLAGAGAPDADAVGDPASRYAAIEALVAASQAAVRHAPTDPFVNGVLVSAVAEREHVLRQIASAQTGNWF